MKAFKIIIVMSFVAMVNIEKVKGQSYHFSNGWNPGKRSMQEPICHFRPEVKTIISNLIEDEVQRMLSDSSCLGGGVGKHTLRNMLRKDIAYDVPLDDKK